MKQPEGFVEEGKEHLVCKLKQSLCGLKPSPRMSNQPVIHASTPHLKETPQSLESMLMTSLLQPKLLRKSRK